MRFCCHPTYDQYSVLKPNCYPVVKALYNSTVLVMRLQEHCYLFDVILVYQKVARIARDFWGNFGAIFAKLPNCHFCSLLQKKRTMLQ